ncbi:MAG: hypothetical protein JRI80_19540 [Deltaproteobacteria bacterium]|nr:hypothetical protein [Deltaproteobacteria bacterium]
MKIFDDVLLTSAFAGNEGEFNTLNTQKMALYVEYTKGDETGLEIKLKKMIVDDDTNEYDPSVRDETTGIVTLLPNYKFTVSGLYRVEISGFPKENLAKIAAQYYGAAVGPGKLTLYVINDGNQSSIS